MYKTNKISPNNWSRGVCEPIEVLRDAHFFFCFMVELILLAKIHYFCLLPYKRTVILEWLLQLNYFLPHGNK